jgi:hypothetical protein
VLFLRGWWLALVVGGEVEGWWCVYFCLSC